MCASKSLSCVCAAAGPQANKASRTALENRIIGTLLASSAAKEGLGSVPAGGAVLLYTPHFARQRDLQSRLAYSRFHSLGRHVELDLPGCECVGAERLLQELAVFHAAGSCPSA